MSTYADDDLAAKLLTHRGHNVEIVTYGATDENVTLECNDCGTVLITFDLEGELLAAVEARFG